MTSFLQGRPRCSVGPTCLPAPHYSCLPYPSERGYQGAEKSLTSRRRVGELGGGGGGAGRGCN